MNRWARAAAGAVALVVCGVAAGCGGNGPPAALPAEHAGHGVLYVALGGWEAGWTPLWIVIVTWLIGTPLRIYVFLGVVFSQLVLLVDANANAFTAFAGSWRIVSGHRFEVLAWLRPNPPDARVARVWEEAAAAQRALECADRRQALRQQGGELVDDRVRLLAEEREGEVLGLFAHP